MEFQVITSLRRNWNVRHTCSEPRTCTYMFSTWRLLFSITDEPPTTATMHASSGYVRELYTIIVQWVMQYKNVLLCPPVSQSLEGGRIRIRWCDPGCFELCIIFIVLCAGAICASNGGVQFPFIVMCDLIDVLTWNSRDTRGTGNRAPSS